MLPQAASAPADAVASPCSGVRGRWLGALALLGLAVLAVASGASALHGGVDVQNLHPDAFTPGQTVRLNFSEPDDDPTSAYLATEVVVHAPTVDGTELAFDPSGEQTADGNWTVDASGPNEIAYAWNGSGLPKAPGNVTVAVAEPLDEIEGDAVWRVEFCARLAEVQHCPDGHDAEATIVYDNKAPETTVDVTDLRNNTAPPFYQEATLTVNATDGGSGVNATLYNSDVPGLCERVVNASIHVTCPGNYSVTTWSRDAVGNEESPRKTTSVHVVDGLTFAYVDTDHPAGGGPSDDKVTVVVGFAGAPEATYPIDLRLQTGPASLDNTGIQTTQDGAAVYQLDPTKVGTYVLEADHPNLPNVTSPPIDVTPGPLSRIEISPSSTTVDSGGTVAFQADGFDAYNNSVAVDPTWAASCGDITQQGQFIASTAPGTCTVVASARSSDGDIEKGTAQVHVEASGSDDGSGQDEGSTGSLSSVSDLSSSTHPVETWVNATQLEITWSAPDADAAGYAYTLTQDAVDPGSDADTTSTSAAVTVPGDGEWIFTVAPVYGDGSVGPTSTYGPIQVDTESPVPPGQVEVDADTSGVTLAWQLSQDDGDSPVSSYLILRRGPGDDTYEVRSDGTIDGTTFRDADVRPGATYRYRVAAIDAAGNRGPPAKSVAVQVPEDAQTSASGSGGDGPATLTGLYDALGVEPGGAQLADEDGDGTADALTGDPRLSVVKETTVRGQTALLVALGDASPTALVLTDSGQSHELGRADAEVGGKKLSDSGVVVTAKAESYDGWALVAFEDPLPDTDLKKVLSKDGETIGGDRTWRVDGQLVLLDDGAETYILQYAESPQARSAAGGEATPGPSLTLGAAALAGAALLVRRRRS